MQQVITADWLHWRAFGDVFVDLPAFYDDWPPLVRDVPRVSVLEVTKARRPRIKRLHSFSDLLDRLEETMGNLGRKDVSYGLNPVDRKGYRALGPYIPVDKQSCAWDAKLAPTRSYPSLIFVASNDGDYSDETVGAMLGADFLFASRIKTPWDVEQVHGVCYRCGAAVRGGSRDKDSVVKPGKLAWIYFYIAIDSKSRTVQACRELVRHEVQVKGHGKYVRKEWALPFMDEAEKVRKSIGCPADWTMADILAFRFIETFNFWAERDRYWNVSVRRGDQRATFCIDNNDAKGYFRDRGKTALTPSGKRRPIVHLVTEHERILETGATTTVREHLRGLRQFDWKGFACAVNAPKFHILATDCEIEGLDQEDAVPGERYLSSVEFARRLANLEDRQGHDARV